MEKIFRWLAFAAVFAAGVEITYACDLCGCYTPQLDATVPEGSSGIYAGVAEQFTHFGTDRFDGHKVSNPTGEYLDSSITQLVVGSSLPFFDDRFGLQLGLPIINRDFKRPKGFAIDSGDVFGIGDISLTANFIAYRKNSQYFDIDHGPQPDGKNPIPVFHEPNFSAIINLTAGLKMPTGDTSRLKENFHEIDIPGAPQSGIGGHDLTLGTGSWDGIFGAQGVVRYKSVFIQADVAYNVRSEGDYQYQFANDLSWSGGPGVYLTREKERSLGVQFVTSGDTKGYDKFQGQPDTDTGMTAVYVGPRILGTFGRWVGEATFDLPVLMNTTQFQTAPTWRIRGGFSYRF
jgi:hypothetical protein